MTDELPEDRPREGEGIHQWMARRQAEMVVEAAKEPTAYLQELSDWVEAHPDAKAPERSAAFDQIKQTYPVMVEYDRKSRAWSDWRDEHLDDTLAEKEAGYFEIWGVEDDEDAWEDDPDFWEYDPDDPNDPRNAR